jgi:hypothetical protein
MPAPANDNFASAEVFSGTSGTTSGTTYGATEETDENPYGWGDPPNALQSVWYKFVAPTTGRIIFKITPGSTNPSGYLMTYGFMGTAIGAFSPAFGPGGVNPITSYTGGAQQTMQAAMQSGSQVNFEVMSIRDDSDPLDASAETFNIEWVFIPAPPNNDFADAEVISGDTGSVEGTNWDAYTEVGEPTGGYPNQTVWYEYTPAHSGVHIFHIDGNGWVQPEFYSGSSLGALTPLTERSYPHRWGYELVGGTPYMIRIGGNSATFNYQSVTEFVFRWEYCPVPANDDFADAEVITGSSGSLQHNLTAATMETGDPDDSIFGEGPWKPGDYGTSTKSIWYKWTSPITGILRLAEEQTQKNRLGIISRTIGVFTGTTLSNLERVGFSEFNDRNWYQIDGLNGAVINNIDVAVQAGVDYYIEIGAGSESTSPPTDLSTLHWWTFASSLWDGEWGASLPMPTPNPGTNGTGGHASAVSAIIPIASFRGASLPTVADSLGTSWVADSGNEPPIEIAEEGLKMEIETDSDYQEIDYNTNSAFSGGLFVPQEGYEWQMGIIVNGIKWINGSDEPNWTFESPLGGFDIQSYDKGCSIFFALGRNSFQGDYAIATGRKYRLKWDYDPDVVNPPWDFVSDFLNDSYALLDGYHLSDYVGEWESDSTIDLVHEQTVGESAGLCGAISTNSPSSANYDVQGRMGKLGNPLYLGARVVAASGDDFDGYFVKVSSDGHLSIVKRAGGTETTLASTPGIVVTRSGPIFREVVGIRVRGNQISAYVTVPNLAHEPTPVLTATDSTYSAAGRVAVLVDEDGTQTSGFSGIFAGTNAQFAGRKRGYLSADAGATWLMIAERWDTTEWYSSSGYLPFAYSYGVNSDDTGWSGIFEGWVPPVGFYMSFSF